MKTLFESPSKLVKYSLTFVAFFITLGIIFAAVFGFNGSTEYNGYYEISIDSFDAEREEKIDNSVEAVLSEYGYSVTEKLVEDRDYCETLVYRYHSNSTQNANEILSKLTTNLSLSEGMISVEKLTNAYNGITVWKYILAIAVLSVVVFFSALIRGGIKYSTSLTSATLLSSLLSLAIIAFTRILLSKSLVVLSLVFAAVACVLTIALINKIKEQKEYNQTLSYKEAYMKVISSCSKLNAFVMLGVIMVIPVVLLLTFNYSLVMLGLGYLVYSIVTAFISFVLSPAIFILMEDSAEEKTKKLVSRNTQNK